MDVAASCSIPSDPDISGIGVRIAIYTQNLLCFVPAFWALSDGVVNIYELDSAEAQTTTNLVLAFAILISTIVQGLTLGLSNYHAVIVLTLSWMNNTNAFVYFLLYIHHKSQSGPEQIKPEWSAWWEHIRKQFGFTGIEGLKSDIDEELGFDQDMDDSKTDLDEHKSGLTQLRRRMHFLYRFIVGRMVLLIGSIHLTLMAALGVWLWSNSRTFGKADACAVDYVFLTIIGKKVAFSNHSLRVFSVFVYSVFLVPALNIAIPSTGIFVLYITWQKYAGRSLPEQPQDAQDTSDSNSRRKKTTSPCFVRAWYRSLPDKPRIAPIVVCLLFLLAMNVILIVDIELTLITNKYLQESTDESVWGFGQVLAILLICLPLRDLAEALLNRQAKRTRNRYLKKAIQEESLDWAVELVEKGADVNLEVVYDQTNEKGGSIVSIHSYLDIDEEIEHKYRTVLELAIWTSKTNVDVTPIRRILHRKGNPNHLPDDCFKTKLHFEISRRKNRLPDISDGKYKSIFETACKEGDLNLVKLLLACGLEIFNIGRDNSGSKALLGKGANPPITVSRSNRQEIMDRLFKFIKNVEDRGIRELLLNHYIVIQIESRIVLDKAIAVSQVDVIKLLSKTGFDFDQNMNANGPPLATAVRLLTQAGVQNDEPRLAVVKALLKVGADANLHEGEALRIAVKARAVLAARALLEGGANASMNGGWALLHAVDHGHEDIVQELLKGGAQPNIRSEDSKYKIAAVAKDGTAFETKGPPLLIAVRILVQAGDKGDTTQPRLEVIKALLKGGADANSQDGEALWIAVKARAVSAVRALLKGGADANMNEGRELMHAVNAGHEDIVRELLNGGAQPNIQSEDSRYKISSVDKDGTGIEKNDPPLVTAVRLFIQARDKGDATQPRLEVIKALLKGGADANSNDGKALRIAVEGRAVFAVRALLKGGADANMNEGRELMHAVNAGHEDIVRELLNGGAQPNIQKNDSPLVTAVRLFIQAGDKGDATQPHLEVIKTLLVGRADANSNDGKALRIVVEGRAVFAVRALLDGGADAYPNAGCEEIVKTLLIHGADVNVQNGYALRTGAKHGLTDIVRALLLGGADPNIGDGIALRDAVTKSLNFVVNVLLLGRANPNLFDPAEGKTPLHFASSDGKTEIARILLDWGADPTLRPQDKSPYDEAVDRGDTEMVNLFNNHIREAESWTTSYAITQELNRPYDVPPNPHPSP